MAIESVATKNHGADNSSSSTDLFLRNGDCLTVRLDQNRFGPCPDALTDLHETVLGLGKAVGIIGDGLEEGAVVRGCDIQLALNGLADAIALTVTLAQAVNTELHRNDAETLASAA